MMHSFVHSSKGQLKIQQMAFVLVAIMIFFAMALLLYFTVKISSLQNQAIDIREQAVLETVRKISSSPEFAFTGYGECPSCVDIDKVFLIKDKAEYESFWNVPYLSLEKIYPNNEVECVRQNYPECGKITLVDQETDMISHASFVALCSVREGYKKCELGKIVMGFRT